MLPAARIELDAVNGALAHLGEPLLSSLDEDRKAARDAKRLFGPVRDALLRMHDWNFAEAFDQPAVLPDASPNPRFPYLAPLPADFLRMRHVSGLGDDAWVVTAAGRRSEDGEEVDILVLASVSPSPHFSYTRRVSEPRLWDATFMAVFELMLAAKLAPGIGKDSDEAERMEARARALLPTSRRIDAREQAQSSFDRNRISTLACR